MQIPLRLMLIAVCVSWVSAWTATTAQYEDASCTTLTPVKQTGWTANPITVKKGECKNWLDHPPFVHGYGLEGECEPGYFVWKMYPSGCGKKDDTNPLNQLTGKCTGFNGAYFMSTCKK